MTAGKLPHLWLMFVALSRGPHSRRLKPELWYKLTIFSAIATPMAMWCSAGYVTSGQKYYVPSALHVFLFLVALAVSYALLAILLHYVVLRVQDLKGVGAGSSSSRPGSPSSKT